MFRFVFCLTLTSTALGGCSSFPELAQSVTQEAKEAGYPDFLVLDRSQIAQPHAQPASLLALPDRVARLNQRAARLRGSVLTRAERRKLQNN